MRIGKPARKHGVPDEDILHGARHAMRLITMEENVTMLIGPASDGTLLEVGVLDLNGDDPVIIHAMPCARDFIRSSGEKKEIIVRHTDDEIERAAERFDHLADGLDPATVEADDTEDLRAVATASEAARADEARLREAVETARAHGRSWNHIAVALGVTRQAARQRFGRPNTRRVA